MNCVKNKKCLLKNVLQSTWLSASKPDNKQQIYLWVIALVSIDWKDKNRLICYFILRFFSQELVTDNVFYGLSLFD